MRDLEIALVLAREMKAAAARSVDASLRLDQLQEVFGVEELDRAERARIQTALQMAGLEPFPSLLDADPSAPIRFGAAKTTAAGAVAEDATVPGEAEADASPPPAEPPAEAPPTFPTVGQFARSKLGRRRRGRRGDHDDGGGRAVPPVESGDEEPEDEPVVEVEETAAYEVPADTVEREVIEDDPPAVAADSNGAAPAPDYEAEAEVEVAAEAQAEPEVEPEAEWVEDDAGPEVELESEDEEDGGGETVVADVVPEYDAEPEHDDEPETVAEPEPVAEHDEEPDHDDDDEPEPVADHDEPDHDHEPAHDEPAQPEYVPLVPPDRDPNDDREYIPLVAAADVDTPEPKPTAPQSEPAGARMEDVVALLLPAVAIPVIVTSIAGWRFGLPFVALSVIATGWLLGRRAGPDGERRGLWATLRESPAAGAVLKTTALVTVLSVGAAVLLASVGKDSPESTADDPATPAKQPDKPQKPDEPAAAAKPDEPAKPAKPEEKKKPKKPESRAPETTNEPAPDPATEGLIRVPPGSPAPTDGRGPTGTGTEPGTDTTP